MLDTNALLYKQAAAVATTTNMMRRLILHQQEILLIRCGTTASGDFLYTLYLY